MVNEKPELRSTIHKNQTDFIFKKIKEEIDTSLSPEESRIFASEAFKKVENVLGTPLFENKGVRRNSIPFLEDVSDDMEEISADIDVMMKEHKNASQFLVDSFNYVHSEKKRLMSKVSALDSLVGDLNLISNEKDDTNLYIKESFQNAKVFDENFTVESITPAQISSLEGILTLGRKSTENLSEEAWITMHNGNGDAGTGHMARRIQLEDEYGNPTEKYIFVNDNKAMANDDINSVLDTRPDTIFEYQMVNVPDSFINQYKQYDFEWVKGKKSGDRLQLKVLIELKDLKSINWININPYYPPRSTNKVQVYSIRTSTDGFEYKGLFEDGNFELNTELNELPQTYRLDDLFDGSNDPSKGKFVGQGVFAFPAREAKFVEIIFNQNESYPEVIGQEVYYTRTSDQDFWTQVPKVKELADSPTGEYIRYINGESHIYRKEIEVTEGWRYVIALRDINIMSYEFYESSSFVSKRYDIEGEIQKVMLYANEKIPKNYLSNLKLNNTWIIYEVSFDDITWHQISPMHHEPLEDDFPPKILEVNSNEIDLTSSFQIHKKLIKTKNPENKIRLKITLTRPKEDTFKNTTPILEDYALRIVRKEGF